jgi:hypothetical protein
MAMSVKITDYRRDAILFGAIILEGLLPPFSGWKSSLKIEVTGSSKVLTLISRTYTM